MANIQKSVSRAFEVTKDIRIDYNVAEKGSASLITGVFEKDGDRATKFYSKPDITNDESTKLAIIYGKVMITPFLVDAGVESSTNDPSQILKTYRFLAGDGETGGVVTGPNGSPLENVYIVDKNAAPVPVVNGDGRPSTGDVILASVLGQAVTSAPKLWDALKSSTPPEQKTTSVDPVTGKAIPTPTASAQAAVVPSLDELRNVGTSGKGENYVLAWDPEQGMWVATSINALVEDIYDTSEVCGGDGGTGGSGGSGGNGGAGGTGGTGGAGGGDPSPAPEDCLPTATAVNYPCIEAPEPAGINGMILLPTLANTANNEYSQNINAVSTQGIELHFFAKGSGKAAVWDATDIQQECPDDTVDTFPCLTTENISPAPSSGGKVIGYYEAAPFDIRICLGTTICGTEYIFHSETFTKNVLSTTSFTFAKQILWSGTQLGPLLDKFPGQIINKTNPNIKVYLSRVDVCGSEFPLYFEGYTRIIANQTNRQIDGKPSFKGSTNALSPKPGVARKEPDDNKFPAQRPASGSLGAPTCVEDVPLPGTPGSPGTPGTGGSGGTGGTSGTGGGTGSCGTVTIEPPLPQPQLALAAPCAKVYGTQTTPGLFDDVKLPSATMSSGIANQGATIDYSIDIGNGSFVIVGALPGASSSTFGERSLSIAGTVSELTTLSNQIYITPATGSVGEIHYKAILTNANGTKAGTSCVLVPQNLVITENAGACSKLTIDPSTTSGDTKITVTFNGTTKDLTNGVVPFSSTINDTATLIAANINANVAVKNALAVTDAAWLPLYTATATGAEISICAPTAGGSEFNGANVDYVNTGTFSYTALTSIKTFLGGASKTISDFLTNNIPAWDKVSDVLYSIAGNVAGAVIANTIMNNASSLQITIPELDPDAKLAFLYKGRIVRVPQGYNGEARTGHPTYATWNSGGRVWENEWTDNPAWCLYDYLTNKVYGLGNEIVLTAAQETKLLQDLFDVGIYSDELVTDEDGDPQVRYSLNTAITDGTRLEILEQLCSVFRGSYSWHFGGLRIAFDKETTTVKLLVTQANAGEFAYDLSSSKNFINRVNLTYIEPSNFYKEEVVQAVEPNAIKRFGEQTKDLVAFGCTDRSQAIRYANWLLLSEKYNAVTVTYRAGEDHFALVPGDIVQFEDSGERPHGTRYSGRIVDGSLNPALVLDAPISAVAGDYFSVTGQDGTIWETTIASISGVNVTLTAASPTPIVENAVFIASPVSEGKQYYRVVKIEETSTSQYNVTLQVYRTEKFADV